MKNLVFVGVLLLVLGVLSLVVPIPHREDHGVRIGDTKIGVQTESSERLPPRCSRRSACGGCPCLGSRITQDLGKPRNATRTVQSMATPS